MKKQVLMNELWAYTQGEILDCFSRDKLRAFAKKHGVKIGRNKGDTIENIIDRELFVVKFEIGV